MLSLAYVPCGKDKCMQNQRAISETIRFTILAGDIERMARLRCLLVHRVLVPYAFPLWPLTPKKILLRSELTSPHLTSRLHSTLQKPMILSMCPTGSTVLPNMSEDEGEGSKCVSVSSRRKLTEIHLSSSRTCVRRSGCLLASCVQARKNKVCQG